MPSCPSCTSEQVVRNGHADGLQRYKCRHCGKTFNALSATPLARLRQREKWLLQASALDAGLSVRRAATQMGVHRTTAFRWRHRFLTLTSTRRARVLSGVAEADETYTLRSYKGQSRRLRSEQSRAPRRRGGKAAKRGRSAEQVPVLVLRDRSGQNSDFLLERADTRHLTPILRQSLAEDAILCTDSNAALAAAARCCALAHQPINTSVRKRRRGPWHIQNVNAYHSRYKNWMRRFLGVSTSYLANYLGWFRAVARNGQTNCPSPKFLPLGFGV